MNANKPTQMKVFCRNCKQATNHLVVNTTTVSHYWEEIGEGEGYDYYTLQCKGCETVCLLEVYEYSEDRDPITGDYEKRRTIYPSPFETRKGIKETYYLPKSIAKIYAECIKAFNNKLPVLTSIGLRALVEGICADKKIIEGSLYQKIEKLVSGGYMTKQEAELLHLNRYMGNAAAHELQAPTEEELETGLDIVETTLRNAYILPRNAEKLEKYKKKENAGQKNTQPTLSQHPEHQPQKSVTPEKNLD